MFDIDWQQLLVPSGSVAEIVLRGSVVYLVLFAVLRLMPRRTIGSMGPSDLLVLVIIADAVQNAMSDGYESLTEGLVLAATIVAWATVIDWLDYRYPHWHLASAKPLPLIRDGQLLHANLKRQQVTEEEVMAQLRQHGLASARDVVTAYLEGDGRMSVLTRSGAPRTPPERKTGQS